MKSNWIVPYVDLAKHYIALESEIMPKVREIMLSGQYILRDEVEKFEENMAKYLSVKFVIGLNSGTDALFLALKSLGISNGDNVITVAHTHVSTVASIIHLGAYPILVDVGEDYNISVKDATDKFGLWTRAIIPVHLNGRACDMDQVVDLAKRNGLRIIEDACQSLGASFKGKLVGTYGIGCFSLHPLKVLSVAGDGGFIATNDVAVASNIKLLRNHGLNEDKVSINMLGYNSRLDNIQAAIANIQLPYLNDWISRRRQIAEIYNREFADLKEQIILPPNGEGDIYSSYVIRVCKQRKQLKDFLTSQGIETMISWEKPLNKQPALGRIYWLPKTEQLSNEVLSLPIFVEITDDQINHVITSIHNFFKDKV